MTSDEATLARLMCAAQAGDALAYRQLLGMAAPLLMRWFRRKVAPADLDDLVQETLLAVHQRRASWDPARPFLPWLAAIARYRWVDRLRRARVRDADALFDDIAVESGEAALIGRLGCDRLLGMLPGPQAAAIRAVKIEGLSVIEAAARLAGGSLGALAYNLHCPYDSMIYTGLWYGLAVGIAALAGRLVVPRLIRW